MVYDRAAALARCADDAGLLNKLAEMFQAACPALLDEARQAVRSGRRDELRRAAHTLKGSIGHFCAAAALEAAARLERSAREGSDAEIAAMWSAVEDETLRLMAALSGVVSSHPRGKRDDAMGLRHN